MAFVDILAPSIYYNYSLLCLLVPVNSPMYGIDRYAYLMSGMRAVTVTDSSAGGRIVL